MVMIAVAIATSVIGGALIVGDSVRHSLQQMTLLRLGRITHVLHAPTFFRQQLVGEIEEELQLLDLPEELTRIECAPAMLLTGSIESEHDGGMRRAGSVTILGVEDDGWSLLDTQDLVLPQEREIVLGYRTAEELKVAAGDPVTLWIELPSSIPRDSLLGEREETTLEVQLIVTGILPESAGASRFDLNPGQQLPYNAFVNLSAVQESMGLQKIEQGRRSSVSKPARLNTIVVGFEPTKGVRDVASHRVERSLAEFDKPLSDGLLDALSDSLNLTDMEVRLRPVEDRGYVSVESDRMILSDAVAEASQKAADEIGLQSAPVLVYLANEIAAADRSDDSERYSMYSIIAGLPFDSPLPLGPFKLPDGSDVPELADDDIALSAWLAEDLKVEVGDKVFARWHEVGSDGELPEIEHTFTVRAIFPDDDPVSMDENLTPVIEGITDVDSFDDWDQPFEMDMDRKTDRDDDYWTAYRATPKAFVSLETAEQFWNSRYGRYTSVRVAPEGVEDASADQLTSIINRLSDSIPKQMSPSEVGLVFRSVRQEGLKASVGANDFTQLFIGFSFFLILSAIILASLMFRLGMQQRVKQVGLLNSIGWPQRRVHGFFVFEGVAVAVSGAVLGTIGAVYFARLMVLGLTTWWVDAVGTQFLILHVQPEKLAVAAAITVFLAAAVIWMAVRRHRNANISQLLAGNMDEAYGATAQKRRRRIVDVSGVASVILAVAIPGAVIAGVIPDGEAFGGLTWKVVCFFIAGFSCLSAGLLLLQARLQRRNDRTSVSGNVSGIIGLALANAARSPQRSLLTTALIAFATFVIVAVGAGRRNPLSETPDRQSGNGGFSLVAETAQSVLFDLNTTDGRTKLGFTDAAESWPEATEIHAFSVKPGADASCVNLYQTQVPTILGATDEFLQRGGFRFADTPGDNPWMQLNEALPDQDGIPVIPVIGDMNTLQFSLKKAIGDVIYFPNEESPEFALQIVGMLDGSIFQGVLVMTEENLHRVDPTVAGARYFLAEADSPAELSVALESHLNAFGMDTEPVSQRLAGFLAVQNTYLSTFQMLGGLGLLVGTFGLAAVMLRNVIERRKEIALLRAVGFTGFRICRLIVVENGLLLFWGIGFGAVSALLAMLPHLLSTGADVPWEPLGLTLAGVAVIGSLSAVFAVQRAVTVSIRENLTSE